MLDNIVAAAVVVVVVAVVVVVVVQVWLTVARCAAGTPLTAVLDILRDFLQQGTH